MVYFERKACLKDMKSEAKGPLGYKLNKNTHPGIIAVGFIDSEE